MYYPDGKHGRIVYYRAVKAWVNPDDEEVKSYWEPFKELSDMKKRSAATQKEKGKYSPHSEPYLKAFPEVLRVMWDCWYDDGTPRELGKLSVSLTGSGVAIQLTDPGERATAFTNAETLGEALSLLEDALKGRGDPWRPWPKGFGRK